MIEKILAKSTKEISEWDELCANLNTNFLLKGSRLTEFEEEQTNLPVSGKCRFLVKWKDEAYIHCSWESLERLQACFGKANVQKHLENFQKQGNSDSNAFRQIHRIIDVREASSTAVGPAMEYLVKWSSLGYDACTWETHEDLEEFSQNLKEKISEFQKRKAKPKGKSYSKKDTSYSSARSFKNNRKLRSYQVEAVDWLTFNFASSRNSILADEMGLGKTCQSVSFVHRLNQSLNVSGPFLIIGPLATLGHWQREFEVWTDFNCVTYHGSKIARNLIRQKELKNHFDVIITNYETVLSDLSFLKLIDWSLLIVDEAHRLKNHYSKFTVALRQDISFDSVLLLTGTPIQNNLRELWTLLNFIAPSKFDSVENFEGKWGEMKTAEQMHKFHDMLRPFMLRRVKKDVEKLPPRIDTMIEVELTTLQKRFYRAIYEKNHRYLRAGVAKGHSVSLNNIAMQLRKCCCHPYLLNGVEEQVLSEEIGSENGSSIQEKNVMEKLIMASGKMILLDKLLPRLKSEGHRVLIFSQMTRMLDILEDYLRFKGFLYERIDGSVSGVDRQIAIDRFSAEGSQSFCFLLSTRGCGQGINLTAADTIIMFDGDWNPQNDNQALARCHRIGQKKEVHVYRMITRKSYEQTMFLKANLKLGLDQAIMAGIEQNDADGEKAKNKTVKSKKEQDEETERMLKFGAYALQDGEDDAEKFLSQDIDEILKTRTTTIHSDRSQDKNSNQLSKATFITDPGDKNASLDVDDPNFWSKVIGLKESQG